MNGDGKVHDLGIVPAPDPRIPYDPANEVLRFEMVLTREGVLQCSFPPPQLEGQFWKFYVLLADLAKSHYGTKARESLIASPPRRFHP